MIFAFWYQQIIHGLLPPNFLTPSLLRESGDLKVILSDIDGTLLSTKHRLSQPTYEAIQRSRTSDYQFYPCTGRSRTSMNNAEPRITSLFGGLLGTPGVYQQGLMVYGKDGTLIYEKFLDQTIVASVCHFCADNGLAVVAYCGERIFCRQTCPQTEKLQMWSDPLPEIYTRGLEKLNEININVHKLIVLDDEEKIVQIRPLLAKALGTSASLTRAVPGMLEVLPPGSSKGEGVAVLLDHLRIKTDHVIAFGDGENDVEMLSMVNFGVAVDNAKPMLKDVARALTYSNDENGVAFALNLLCEQNVRQQK